MAEKAGELLPKFLSFDDSTKLRELAHKILSSGEETEVSRRLAEIVSKGAAFHHAGLDSKHRKIIEDAYRNRDIKNPYFYPDFGRRSKSSGEKGGA